MYWVGCSVCQTLLANLGKLRVLCDSLLCNSQTTEFGDKPTHFFRVKNYPIVLSLNQTVKQCNNVYICFLPSMWHPVSWSYISTLIFVDIFLTRKHWFCKLVSKESFAFQEQEHRSSVSSQSSQVASPKHSPLSTTLQQTPSIQNSDGKHFLGKRWTLKPSYHGC